MAQDNYRNYGNHTTYFDNLRLRYGGRKDSSIKSNPDYTKQPEPDCVSCLKHRLGIPKHKQCQAICGNPTTKQRKHSKKTTK